MASLISRFAAVAAVSTGLAVLSMETPANAAAGGFTGSFANWTLTNYADYAPGSPFGAANNSASTVPGPPPLGPGQFTSKASTTSYQCSDPVLSVACVTDFNAAAGTATVVGSNYDPVADPLSPSYDMTSDPTSTNGGPGQSWATQWEMTSGYSGSPDPYTFTFNWAFVPGDVSSDDQSYYYIVDGSNNLTTFTLGSGLASGSKTVTLNAGWKLGFGVYTLSNSGGPGNLAITSFNPVSNVPAPLPLLGAGAAFGWSRRLRSRIRVRSAVAIR